MTVPLPYRWTSGGKWGGLFHLLCSFKNGHFLTFLENFAFSSMSCVSFGLKVLIPALTWVEKKWSVLCNVLFHQLPFLFLLCYRSHPAPVLWFLWIHQSGPLSSGGGKPAAHFGPLDESRITTARISPQTGLIS